MKKTITLFVLFLASITAVKAQIPNASFENWTTAGSYSTPDGWDNFNTLTAPFSVYTCEKGTTGAPHGSSFIMLTTRQAGSTVAPGLAMSGKYDAVTKKPKSGFAYTGRPSHLTGKWQYMASGNDTGRIAVYLTKWNTVTGQRDMVASVEYDLPGMVMSWASFAIPIVYTSGATPDSAVIGLVSSNKGTFTPGSYLYVDSLNFFGHVVGIPAITNSRYSVMLSPNPAKDNLSVDFGTVVTENVKLSMIDVCGRLVMESDLLSGQRQYSINLSAVTPGTYFVKLNIGTEVQTLRLVVE